MVARYPQEVLVGSVPSLSTFAFPAVLSLILLFSHSLSVSVSPCASPWCLRTQCKEGMRQETAARGKSE